MFWVVNFVKHVGSTPGDVVLLAFRCFSGGATPQNIVFCCFLVCNGSRREKIVKVSETP